MTATDELRRMLDERGVEWVPIAWNPKKETFYHTSNGVGFCADEYADGVKIYTDATITPEQAIEATLGRGECRDERSGTVAFKCSECGCWVAYDEDWSTGVYAWVGDEMKSVFPHYCPNCGRKVEQDG